MHRIFRRFPLSVGLSALLSSAAILLAGCLPTIDVVTSYGTLRGTTANSVNSFLGVPYAQPPLGALRWRAPQPMLPWSGTRDASSNGPACVQGGQPTGSFVTSEDCLTLNIWAPATPGPHPVMVWLHGGAFLLGAGNEPEYDGSTLAREQDVVVIGVNYRLSFMGFLALPQLGAENGDGHSGNQGFYDQLAALQWVKQEISNFGGDPANVTLFGESAGAISSCLHLASPLSDGLFKRVVMESGNCRLMTAVPQAQAEQTGTAFLAKLGCSGDAQPLDCARGKTAQQLLDALNIPFNEYLKYPPAQWAFNPNIVIDGHFLTQPPMELLAAGAKPSVEVLIGTNKDEGTLFTEMVDHAPDAAGYLAELQAMYGTNAAALSILYPHGDYPSTGAAMAAVVGDAVMHCPGRELADLLSETGHTVYEYDFVQPVAGLVDGLMNLQRGTNTSDIGTFHSAEIPYVFGFASVLGSLDTADQQQTAHYMTQYWTDFARSGNPNGDGLPLWPAYSKAKPDYLELGGLFASKSAYRDTFCQYWAAHPALSE